MKKLACLSVVTALIALGMGGATLAPAPAGAQAKPIVWNLPHVAAPTYYHTVNLNAFAAKVKEKSGGRMEIRVHPASSLYPQQEILPSLLDGRSEIGPVLSGYLTDVLLELGVLELPFMTSSLDEHRRPSRRSSPSSPSSSARRGSSCSPRMPGPRSRCSRTSPSGPSPTGRGRRSGCTGRTPRTSRGRWAACP